MPKRASDYRSRLLEDLKDPIEAAAYINAANQESREMFLIALRNVAEAHQMSRIAKTAGVSRESIYRMLRGTGNPAYSSLSGILRAMRLRIRVEPEWAPARKPARIQLERSAFSLKPQTITSGRYQTAAILGSRAEFTSGTRSIVSASLDLETASVPGAIIQATSTEPEYA